MKKYRVAIKVEGEDGFFHLFVNADNEEEAKEYALNMHLNEWGKHRGLAMTFYVRELES